MKIKKNLILFENNLKFLYKDYYNDLILMCIDEEEIKDYFIFSLKSSIKKLNIFEKLYYLVKYKIYCSFIIKLSDEEEKILSNYEDYEKLIYLKPPLQNLQDFFNKVYRELNFSNNEFFK